MHNVCDHEACYRECNSQAISYTTGVPAMIGAKMVLTGAWKGAGVFNMEQLDPDPFYGGLEPPRSAMVLKPFLPERGRFDPRPLFPAELPNMGGHASRAWLSPRAPGLHPGARRGILPPGQPPDTPHKNAQ